MLKTIKTCNLKSNFIRIDSDSCWIVSLNGKYFQSDLIFSPHFQLDNLVFELNSIPSESKFELINPADIDFATKIVVKPLDFQDWEILSSNPGLFENIFINQCRLVFKSQVVILWHNSLVVKVVVQEGFGRLMEGTEVIVEPLERFKSVVQVMKVKISDSEPGLAPGTEKTLELIKVENYDYQKVVDGIQFCGIYHAKLNRSANQVYLSTAAIKELDLKPDSLAKVTTLDPLLQLFVEKIKVYTDSRHSSLREWIRKRQSNWICDGMCVDGIKIAIQSQDQEIYLKLDDKCLESLLIEYEEGFLMPAINDLEIGDLESFCGFEQEIDSGIRFLDKVSSIPARFNLAMNIYGPPSTGKSTVAKTLARKLSSFPIFITSQEINSLSAQDMHQKLENIYEQVIYHSSILIIKLDDVNSTEKETKTEGVLRALKACVKKVLKIGLHCIIISSAKLKDWDVGMYIQLDNPDKKRIASILRKSIGNLAENVAGLMVGYSLGEIGIVLGNARLNSQLRGGEIDSKDFIKAVSNTKPLALAKTNLSNPTVMWKDIGGHESVKKILLQTLKWPSVYSRIFSQSPLRPRSGILLYGYPGCGKTILAHALAKESNLSLVVVNGPELLNKYIGQSEKSTRDVFSRAFSARPCLLFFDEFEAIAPRRGGDGVTDRVVNQILTEIDGAEGLEGVYVVGATTRPDLVDPAVLRPGRLDKRVFVGMPEVNERKEILEKVGGASLDWGNVAKMTEGFTGADLKGLIASAQLLAIHQNLDRNKEVPDVDNMAGEEDENGGNVEHIDYLIVNGKEHVGELVTRRELNQKVRDAVSGRSTYSAKPLEPNSVPKIVITHTHVLEALRETRSSLSLEEKRKLDHIYTKFAGGEVDINVASKSTFKA